MPIVCEKADKDELDLLREVQNLYHPWMIEADVRVAMIMVYDDSDNPKPPLRHGGAVAAARIQRLGPRDRLLTGNDLLIEVDQVRWNKLNRAEKVALLDHECTHAVKIRTNKGRIALHEDGRPKIGMQHDDYTINGFFAVAKRHRQHSAEVRTLSAVLGARDDNGQLWLPFDVKLTAAANVDDTEEPSVTLTHSGPGLETKTVKLTRRTFENAKHVADRLKAANA